MKAAAGQEWPLSGCAGGRRPSPSACSGHEGERVSDVFGRDRSCYATALGPYREQGDAVANPNGRDYHKYLAASLRPRSSNR